MSNANTNISPDADLKFDVTRENPNHETAAAMDEYDTMKKHPDQYKHYASFSNVVNEVLNHP